jgi:hypothetical protein
LSMHVHVLFCVSLWKVLHHKQLHDL